MTIFDYAWMPNFFEQIGELKGLAMREDWDYKEHPTGRDPILTNYVKHTFVKLYEEGRVCEYGDYSLFNTGLVTNLQEEIFALFQKNRRDARQGFNLLDIGYGVK